MGRMHTHRHGKSHSIRPATLRVPSWVTLSPKEVEELIIKYSKDGLTPSQIGIKLRDQHSIPLVKPIIKKSLGQVLEENDLKADMPEDLGNIVNKAVGLQKHLKENKGDNRNVRSLEYFTTSSSTSFGDNVIQEGARNVAGLMECDFPCLCVCIRPMIWLTKEQN